MKEVIVVIPSLDPDCEMVKYVKGLIEIGFKNILVIDDGSKEENKVYFDEIEKFNEVTILHHAVNQGKGRALKTAFNYVLNVYNQDEIVGVVTADADGQHSVEDTLTIADTLKNKREFILGSRDFNAENVPFKSRFGNKITTVVFGMLYGKYITDTQTGLRGIPYSFLSKCLGFTGERFEYEIVMLMEAVRNNLKIAEKSIQTIYINSNRATHFHAVWDSMRIYKIMLGSFLRFSLSGLVSFVIDISIFALLLKAFSGAFGVVVATFWGTVIARIMSSLFNYSVNKAIVFGNRSNKKTIIFKYYLLCIGQMLSSWLLVILVLGKVCWDTTLIKVIVDCMLFIISYQIQRRWVFKEEE